MQSIQWFLNWPCRALTHPHCRSAWPRATPACNPRCACHSPALIHPFNNTRCCQYCPLSDKLQQPSCCEGRHVLPLQVQRSGSGGIARGVYDIYGSACGTCFVGAGGGAAEGGGQGRGHPGDDRVGTHALWRVVAGRSPGPPQLAAHAFPPAPRHCRWCCCCGRPKAKTEYPLCCMVTQALHQGGGVNWTAVTSWGKCTEC